MFSAHSQHEAQVRVGSSVACELHLMPAASRVQYLKAIHHFAIPITSVKIFIQVPLGMITYNVSSPFLLISHRRAPAHSCVARPADVRSSPRKEARENCTVLELRLLRNALVHHLNDPLLDCALHRLRQAPGEFDQQVPRL